MLVELRFVKLATLTSKPKMIQFKESITSIAVTCINLTVILTALVKQVKQNTSQIKAELVPTESKHSPQFKGFQGEQLSLF